MWRVVEAAGVGRQLGRAPKQVQEKYEFWRSVAELDGPKGLRRLPGFRDHALKGEWRGRGRLPYPVGGGSSTRFVGDELTVFVLEVNPHDYRKKD